MNRDYFRLVLCIFTLFPIILLSCNIIQQFSEIHPKDKEIPQLTLTIPAIDYYATALVNLSHQLTADANKIQQSPTPTITPILLLTSNTQINSPTDNPFPPNDYVSQLEPNQGWSYSEELYSGIRGPSNRAPLTYWRYGPQNWGLVKGYELCNEGAFQSPIDIISQTAKPSSLNIFINYQAADIQLMSNEFTFQADVPPSSYLYWQDIPFELLDFTFHSPSEHTIEGLKYDMEIQFFHQAADGRQLILSVLLVKGKENPALQTLWANLPPPPFNMRKINQYNPIFLLPHERTAFIYQGSLTTPPCFEDITWIVFKEPMELSSSQLQAYRTLFPANARPLQPLNNREIQLIEVKNKEPLP